ncbi:MAG TPA: PAS domain-containing protein, partial [Thermoanaerobaculia bacterium]|nr:PAS domain-containing protein [Thermoanaerobaculia bacterium]
MHKRKAIHPPVRKAPTEGPDPTTRGGRPRGRAYLLADARVALRPSKPKQRGVAPTQSSILNAIPAHIALVDREGTILAVNDGWRQFAERNGLRIRAFGVGRSYLEVCDRAEGDFSEHARAAAAGLRAVLRGEAREFSLEYPCHSPPERRWFRLMV